MKTWTVYMYISPSNKVYVGITSNLKHRWSSNGKNYCVGKSIFKNALEKYGWNGFQHVIVLEGISKSEAVYAEKYLIRWYKIHNCSYNVTDGGEGTLGMTFSEERIQKARESKIANKKIDYLVIDKNYNYIIFQTTVEAAKYLGVKSSNVAHILDQPIGYTCKKHYIWKHEKGTSVNIEDIKKQIENVLSARKKKLKENIEIHRDKMVAAARAEAALLTKEQRRIRYAAYSMKGKHHSEETKRKMSEAAKGRDMSKAIEASINTPHDYISTKAVLQFDLDDNYINEFPSIQKAKLSLGKKSNAISNCLTGRAKTAFGYRWEYKNMGGQGIDL